MGRSDLNDVGLSGEPGDVVRRLAVLAHDCALDGVVSSALEALELRRTMGEHFCLVTPGIRPAGASLDEQKRVTTPLQAIRNGVELFGDRQADHTVERSGIAGAAIE